MQHNQAMQHPHMELLLTLNLSMQTHTSSQTCILPLSSILLVVIEQFEKVNGGNVLQKIN